MKLIFLNIFLLIFITSCTIIFTGNSENNSFFITDTTFVNKGRYTTSAGELRTLFVFVDFQDNDTLNTPGWQWDKKTLPDWANTIVNKNIKLNFPHSNLTDYFYQMSQGKFFFYGDVYPEVVIPIYNQAKYKSIKEVNDEVIKLIDPKVDFSKYDNWSKNKKGKYINKPDGKVDVIFLVYRDFKNKLFFNKSWTGIAHLYLSNNYQTDDGVIIKTGRLDKGSGIQARGGKNGFTYIKYVLAHEFGHLLFGSGHIENVTNLALMTGGPVWNASRGMHSWEREKLGWIKFPDIPLTKNSIWELDDYLSTGTALRIKLSKKEWFIIENHQQISKHDWAKDRGVYIYRINNAEWFAPKITVECADGNWDFKIDSQNEKLLKTIPNPNGKSEMNFKKRNKKKDYSCNTGVYTDNSAWGDKYDAFDTDYNNLFSPVSNPSTKNNAKKEFAIEVKKKIGTKYLLNIYFNNIYKNTPPSKPQVLQITHKNNKLILLEWLQNKEPDLAGYNLYYINSNGNEKKIFISPNKTFYNIASLLSQKAENSFWFTAIDKENKESVRNYFSILKTNNLFNLNRKE